MKNFVNCFGGVIQRFPALKKAVTTHVKKYLLFFFFFTCWYSQSAAYTSLAFGTTRSGWWMNGKTFTILNASCLSELSRIMAAKTLKNPYHWQTTRFNLPRRGRKPIYLKKNRKLRIRWLWCYHFSRLKMKINGWKICHWPILSVYLKDFFCR